jgi:large subunit ribosomal protein L3
MLVVAQKGAEAGPMTFMGYKAGMVRIMGINAHKGSVSAGQEIIIPATVIECPPLKVLAVRAYEKTPYGMRCAAEACAEKADKHVKRKIKSFGTQHSKDKKRGKPKGIEDIEKIKDNILQMRIICHTQPYLTLLPKKKPEIFEIMLSGDVSTQLAYAKERLGGEIKASEIFKDKDFLDIKAVTKGKGFQGPVKRFGVRIQPRKAKKRRIVGSISPWNPSTVMWTVPRAGQMGYHSRTEYNKRIILLGTEPSVVNPVGGFKKYGNVTNEFIVVAGSVAGPAKRAVAMRKGLRKSRNDSFNISEIISVPSAGGGKKKTEAKVPAEEEVEEKAKAVKAVKETPKKESKSVEEEIAKAAAEGGKKV